MDGTNDEFSSTKSNLDLATAVQGSNTISSTTSDPSEGKIINMYVRFVVYIEFCDRKR